MMDIKNFANSGAAGVMLSVQEYEKITRATPI